MLTVDVEENRKTMMKSPNNKKFRVFLQAIRCKTYLVFSFASSSESSVVVVPNDVIFPKDSFASPKKSFTLSRTVFSLSGVGSFNLEMQTLH